MKRWWVIVLLCMLLGAVVNVIVAWGVDQSPAGSGSDFNERIAERRWPVTVPDSWPPEPMTALCDRLPGRTVHVYSANESGVNDEKLRTYAVCGVYEWHCGWPLHSLRRYSYWSHNWGHEKSWPVPGGDECWGVYVWALRLPASLRPRNGLGLTEDGWLALQPLWPGFAANTLLYAAVVWIPLRGVGILRRRRRVLQGRCPACGYSQSGLKAGAMCPECGGAGAQA